MLAVAVMPNAEAALVLSLDEGLIVSDQRNAEVVAIHEALEELAKFDARKSEVVELRFFGGLTIDETAEVLGVSSATVRSDWTTAKPGFVGKYHRGQRTVSGFNKFLAFSLNGLLWSALHKKSFHAERWTCDESYRIPG